VTKPTYPEPLTVTFIFLLPFEARWLEQASAFSSIPRAHRIHSRDRLVRRGIADNARGAP
jgi:hypothetical protein